VEPSLGGGHTVHGSVRKKPENRFSNRTAGGHTVPVRLEIRFSPTAPPPPSCRFRFRGAKSREACKRGPGPAGPLLSREKNPGKSGKRAQPTFSTQSLNIFETICFIVNKVSMSQAEGPSQAHLSGKSNTQCAQARAHHIQHLQEQLLQLQL